MSSLKTNEKQILEKLFQMGHGYVLNFSDRTMSEFFEDSLKVEIYADCFDFGSGSKANRMRGFWNVAEDRLVANSINELIEYIENQILLERLHSSDFPQRLLEKGREIGVRLRGDIQDPQNPEDEEEQRFIDRKFDEFSIANLKLEPTVEAVVRQRIKEIEACLSVNAPLSVVFLCGSTLEGILLGLAKQNPQSFNQAYAARKKDGKVLPFQFWTLDNLINVSRELAILGEDVKKFSHALRDFRNYIHPHEQIRSGFHPHEHTAKISWQVLQAAIFEISAFQSKAIKN